MKNFFGITVSFPPDSDEFVWWMKSLPTKAEGLRAAIYYEPSENPEELGMYYHNGRMWCRVLPYQQVAAALANGSKVSIYTNPSSEVTPPEGSLIYKNGIQINATSIPANDKSLWVVVTFVEKGPQVNSDWNATSGPGLILNKPSVFPPPPASEDQLGGIKVGDGLNIDSGAKLSTESLGLNNYSDIRTYSGNATSIQLRDSYVAGLFRRDDSDESTPDDGALVIVDAIGRRWKRVDFDHVELEWFGARGDGQTLGTDQPALQAALAHEYPIRLRTNAVYLIDAQSTKNGGKCEISGSGTFKLASGMILNTDANFNNFVPILRLQGMSYVNLTQFTVDHNREGQTYPATYNRPGRGTNPFRHNGSIEISPDETGTVPSSNVYIDGVTFINSYLNGLVLWQVQNAWIRLNVCQNTTWNGIAGAGLRNVQFFRNNGWRCGEQSMFGSLLQPGDRALIQIREFPKNMTTQSEGIPCITTGEFSAGGINRFVDITENYGEQCGVETIFGRAIQCLSGGNNRSKDVGYGRNPNAGFYPAHIWFEICEGHNRGNIGYQSVVNPGDAQPDGMVAYSMTGDASALFPFVGNYSLDVSGGRFTSAKDVNGNPIPGLLYRGIRVSSLVNASNTYVDGTDNDGAYGTNFDSFEQNPVCIHDTYFDDSTFINTNQNQDTSVAGGPIELIKFGPQTGGVPTNISALRCTVDAGKNVIVYNGNLNNVAFPPVNVQFSSGPDAGVNATTDRTYHSINAPYYRQVANTYIGDSAIAGFSAQANGGNQLLMGTTSSLYSGSLGVALSSFVHSSGANTGGLFVTATGGPIIARPGGNRSVTMFASGRTRFGTTTADDGVNTIQTDGMIGLRSYTVANLPTNATNGSIAYASNGRKISEAASNGTGVPVYYSNGAWRTYSNDQPVAA